MNLAIFLPVFIVMFVFSIFLILFYFKTKNNVELNNKNAIFYDNILKDFWAQHKDKIILACAWLTSIMAIAALSMVFVPF